MTSDHPAERIGLAPPHGRKQNASMPNVLIRNLHEEGVKRSLVRSIVRLCRELGVEVIAEGVETPEECVAAAELGCNVLQGYLFGRPAEPFAEVLWQVRE